MNLKDKVIDMDRLRGEVDNLRGKLTGAESRVADLHVQLEEQQAANRDLMDAKARLEQELKIANMNREATKKELEAVKKALYDIRSEATLVRGRVRQRYSTKDKK
jgi:septation ring formation regulator EzrA